MQKLMSLTIIKQDATCHLQLKYCTKKELSGLLSVCLSKELVDVLCSVSIAGSSVGSPFR